MEDEVFEVAVSGAGFAGLAAAIQLVKKKVTPIVVFEKEGAVGGVWHKNTYPGCASDIPAHLYSFSFWPSCDWTEFYAPQQEIADYLQKVVKAYRLDESIMRFRKQVSEATWCVDEQLWLLTVLDLDTGQRGVMRACYFIACPGIQGLPSIPNFAGMSNFEGAAFHTAEWDHGADIKGKRVAVIGTGASAIQVVPAIAGAAEHVTVFQRSAPWITYRANWRIPAILRFLLRWMPLWRSILRFTIWWPFELALVVLLYPSGLFAWLITMRSHIIRWVQVRDPELRERVKPSYRFGCKRILLSDHWYPTLQRKDVELVTCGLDKVTATAIVDNEGKVHDVDVIVFATGFKVQDYMTQVRIVGARGESVNELWAREGMASYMGTALEGYPNLFLIHGPHTLVSHTSFVIMFEYMASYIVRTILQARRCGATVLHVKPDAQVEFTKEMRDRLSRMVWVTGGCNSWYLRDGSPDFNWPGSTIEYMLRTWRVDLSKYRLYGPGYQAVTPQPSSWFSMTSPFSPTVKASDASTASDTSTEDEEEGEEKKKAL